MALLVTLFGVFLGTLGLVGMVRPHRLIRMARSWQTPTGLYAAAALRIALGLLLILVAPNSRFPGVLRILGIVILLSGLATPIVGLGRFHRILEWWANRGPAFQRAWASCAFSVGLFLIYAVTP